MARNHKAQDVGKDIDLLKDGISAIIDNFMDYVSDATEAVEKIPEYIQKSERKVCQSVEAHPLSSVGIAVAVGFVLGSIFSHNKQ